VKTRTLDRHIDPEDLEAPGSFLLTFRPAQMPISLRYIRPVAFTLATVAKGH